MPTVPSKSMSILNFVRMGWVLTLRGRCLGHLTCNAICKNGGILIWGETLQRWDSMSSPLVSTYFNSTAWLASTCLAILYRSNEPGDRRNYRIHSGIECHWINFAINWKYASSSAIKDAYAQRHCIGKILSLLSPGAYMDIVNSYKHQ